MEAELRQKIVEMGMFPILSYGFLSQLADYAAQFSPREFTVYRMSLQCDERKTDHAG
jgi:hypothetical protein